MATNDRFRREVAAALDLWVSEDLITPEQRQRLREYYHLDQLEQRAGGAFALILLVLGGILIGLGVISFVAANWSLIPRSVRALVALGLMIGLQVAGYRLLSSPRARLGTALLVMGELCLGASIGLMAQWFQVSGSLDGLFASWGLGVLAVAYGLRHTPSGVLALLLLMPGYFTWFSYREIWFYQPALLPWLTLGLCLPLAYWCRSRLIWFLGSLLLAAACGGVIYTSSSSQIGLGMHLFVALAWGWAGWHQHWLPWLHLQLRSGSGGDGDPDEELGLDFVPSTVFITASLLLTSLYFWSFWSTWRWYEVVVPTLDLPRVLSLWGLVFLTVTLWIGNAQRLVGSLGTEPVWQRLQRGLQLSWGLMAVLTGLGMVWKSVSLVILWASAVAMALGGIVLIAVVWWQQQRAQERNWWRSQSLLAFAWLTLVIALGTGSQWGMTVIWVNLALILASGALIWQGLVRASRWRFWLGLVFLSLTVLTRFFEYETGLLLKSLALVFCGVGVIVAGLRFERTLRDKGIMGQELA